MAQQTETDRYKRYQKTRKGKRRSKRYAKSPKGKYAYQKYKAKKRGIEFLLTFEQWLDIWLKSGHMDERGTLHNKHYVMSRHKDKGPYAVGNVEIISHGANVADRNRNYAAAMRAGITWDYYRNCPQEVTDMFPDPEVPF